MNANAPETHTAADTAPRRYVKTRKHNGLSNFFKALFWVWTVLVWGFFGLAASEADTSGGVSVLLMMALSWYAIPALVLGLLTLVTADSELREIN